jgi:hypothetical protein
MRSITLLPLAAALALCACNRAEKPKSEDEVKEQIARMAKPAPGQYHSTATLVSFEVPGMPPAQAERLKAMFSTAQGRDFCLTKAEADKGFGESTRKLAQGNCSYDRFSAEGGALDAKLTCQTGQGMTATIEMKGTVGETGSNMTMSVNQSAPGMPAGGVRMVAEVSSQRTGDCT